MASKEDEASSINLKEDGMPRQMGRLGVKL